MAVPTSPLVPGSIRASHVVSPFEALRRRWFGASCVISLAAGCRGEPAAEPALPAATECVVLVHGLGRSAASMSSLGRRLRNEGFAVVNYDYESTRATVAEHAAALVACLPALLPAGTPRIHFVTHSLGGIVVREALKSHAVAGVGRVVMLAPPNRGSELADALREIGLLEVALGPAAVELGTRDGDAPRTLGPVAFECGVIAGDFSLSLLGAAVFDGPNDGKVSVEGAKVDGMVDFLVVHRSHTFLMNADEVQEQVVCFLRTGGFDHGAALRGADQRGRLPARTSAALTHLSTAASMTFSLGAATHLFRITPRSSMR